DARGEGVIFGAPAGAVRPALDAKDIRPLLLAYRSEIDSEVAQLQGLLAAVRLDIRTCDFHYQVLSGAWRASLEGAKGRGDVRERAPAPLDLHVELIAVQVGQLACITSRRRPARAGSRGRGRWPGRDRSRRLA